MKRHDSFFLFRWRTQSFYLRRLWDGQRMDSGVGLRRLALYKGIEQLTMYSPFIRTVKTHVVAMLEDGALPHIDWPLLFPRCASVVLDVDLPTGRGCVPHA